MATRARQSTAGPTQRRAGTELPPYEQPAFPLNAAAQRALEQLTRTHNLRKLDGSLNQAQTVLTTTAGEINDRFVAADKNARKRKERDEQAASPDGETASQEKSLDELRDKVERMTQRMDESMRKLIDGRHSVQSIQESVAATAEDATTHASTQASTQQNRSRRRRTREGEDEEEEEDDGEYQDFEPTNPAAGTQTQHAPIDAFKSKLEGARARYQSHSLTARYADNNSYRDFRRVVHDAKHPEGDVEMPHHSEWFDDGEAPAPGVTTRARANAEEEDDDDDDDIAVSRTSISTRCPLTLREFNDPLTSRKCPHSFESEAILSMLSTSRAREGGHPQGERVVRCPVPGCSQELRRDDLHTDAVLVRKIKRLQRAKKMEDEDAEVDGSRAQGAGNATIIDEDEDGADVDDLVRVPQTQLKTESRRTAKAETRPSTAPQASADAMEVDSHQGEEEAEEDEDEDEDEDATQLE